MTTPLSASELETLRGITTPTISNAIEVFGVKSRNQGFMGPEIKCIFRDMDPMVGYACTAVISANQPADPAQTIDPREMWEEIQKIPEPRVVVIKDMDFPRPVGSFWGEVNANVHRALGCVGTVTDGGVRDLEEVRELGFHFFASEVLVSHAYVHLERVGGPITVGGVEVRPGDLVHGDRHGVILIPAEIARDVVQAAEKVEQWERPIIELCKAPDFSIEKLHELYKRPRP